MARTLSALLEDTSRRDRVVDDCVQLIDDEVGKKSGFSGLAIKGAYAVVKAIKKGIIKESVSSLLNGFISKLEPYYERYLQSGSTEPFSALLNKEPANVANALLGFTDDKARNAQNATMKKAYEKLRPSAVDHVQAAVPGLGRVIDKHLAEAAK
jgi:hypothetical protein